MCVESHKLNRDMHTEDSVNTAIINAYYTEVFRRQDRKKKLPDIKKFLVRLKDTEKKKQQDKQTDKQMQDMAIALNAVFGGKVIEN